MTPDALKQTVLDALVGVAPEIDRAQIRPDVPFRDQLDLDSMDMLNFMIALHKALQVDVPESDYRQMATLASCLAYLAGKLAAKTPAGPDRPR